MRFLVVFAILISAWVSPANARSLHGGATTTGGGSQTVSAITVNFVPQGNYTSGSSAVPGTLYFTGGCPSGTQIGSLVATASGGSYGGSWTTTGTNAADFTITGSNPGALKCNGTLAAGSYSFNAVAGTNSFTQAITAYAGQTYYLSPTGNDSNFPCTSSGSPCLSPNHSVHCGDFFLAAASTSYNGNNFTISGTTTCPGNDNVAEVKCATFDACKFSTMGTFAAIYVQANYWGFQGFECDNTTVVSCFQAEPPTSGATIHHIVFANDICNNTGSPALSCFQTNEYLGGTGPSAVDYYLAIGDLAYNGDPGSSECGSNMGYVSPANSDTNAGTHTAQMWNISWHSNGGVGCDGTGTTSDDNGFILDSPNINSYTGQVLIENNWVLGNGGEGIHVFINPCCVATGGTTENVVIRYNTLYSQFQNTGYNGIPWGLNLIGASNNTSYLSGTVEHNLDQETTALHSGSGTCSVNSGNGCVYPFGQQYTIAGSTTVDLNWFAGLASFGSVLNWINGYNCTAGPNVPTPSPDPSNNSCNGNVVGTSPVFTSATVPGAPSCGSAADTLNCMATTIAGFVPTGTGTTVGGSTGQAASNYGANANPSNCDANNSTPFILNVSRALPADMDKCG